MISWNNTAAKAVAEASVWMVKRLEKSGETNTGADTKRDLSSTKDFSASSVQTIGLDFLLPDIKAVIGELKVAKSG